MKITIESTDYFVELIANGTDDSGHMRARVWQGVTEDGIPVHCYITRTVPEVGPDDPDLAVKLSQFARDLTQVAAPRPDVLKAIPARLIL
jgi:hypothetical protein